MNKMTKLMHLYGLLEDVASAKTHMKHLGAEGELGSLKSSCERLDGILQTLQELVTIDILMIIDPTTERERHLNRIFEEAQKRGTGKAE